jgi:hypothetical protein
MGEEVKRAFLRRRPWGLRQFTVEDIDGNRFYFHCD